MKILVISQPAWNDQNNTGNTLSNFFSDTPFEFANLYFGGEKPNNHLCKRYYQISDFDVLNHWIKRKPLGRAFKLESIDASGPSLDTRALEIKAKTYSNFYTQLMRELMWKCTRIVNKQLIQWIDDFHPDLFYAPTFGNFHMLRIVRQIADTFPNIPIISDISDDHYFRFSKERNPIRYFFFFFLLRRSLLKTFKRYLLLYTMTDTQQQLYQPLLKAPIKIMRKKALFNYRQTNKNTPIRIIYAGGLYLGREDVLIKLIEVLTKINRESIKITLDIYSNSETKETLTLYTKNLNFVHLHTAVDYPSLMNIYKQSDIALLLESFDPTIAKQTRMSFSTKIVDALQSGCAILAIGPDSNAGFHYLESNNAAIIINSTSLIEKKLIDCIRQLDKLKENSYLLCKKNHDKTMVTNQMMDDFNAIIYSQTIK